MYLAQTNLEINTKDVYITDGQEVYMTTDNNGVVVKDAFDKHGREVVLYGLKYNSKLRKSLIKK